MEAVTPTRRHWLKAAGLWSARLALGASPKDFWSKKDPATWTEEEKQVLLFQSPWARPGLVRVEQGKNRSKTPGYGPDGRPATSLPQERPGVPSGGVRSVPIGEPIPPVPDADPHHPVQFPAMARWETAKPIRLAGAPDMSELAAEFYVIRLRGLPLMRPPKPKADEPVSNPNEGILASLKQGSRLVRKDKPDILCARLFTGSGDEATQVLLLFPRATNPIALSDKLVTLESVFPPFLLSIKFPLAEMWYKGDLAL